MATTSTSFTATANGLEMLLGPHQTVTYAVTGTFTGFVYLERLIDGNWDQLAATAEDTAVSGTYINPESFRVRLRWRGVVATGTAVSTIVDTDGTRVLPDVVDPDSGTVLVSYRDDGVRLPRFVGAIDDSGATNVQGVGTKNGATVTAVETGMGGFHKTVLTLAATPITLTDEAGVGQYGGTKLYDFPAGNIKLLGATVDVDLTLTNAAWTDAAEGDVAVGSGVPADATALDATAVDIIPETAIAAMTAQVGAINCQSTGNIAPLGSAGGTDDDLNINVRIDDAAAHITDGGTMTGTVTFVWVNLGDY